MIIQGKMALKIVSMIIGWPTPENGMTPGKALNPQPSTCDLQLDLTLRKGDDHEPGN